MPQDRRVGDPSRSAGEAWAAESVSAGRGRLRRGLAHDDRPHLHPHDYELTWWRRIESRCRDGSKHPPTQSSSSATPAATSTSTAPACSKATPDAKPITATGQRIDMDMDRRPLGHPNMAESKVHCTVTRMFADRLIEWTVQATGTPPAGHGWGWQIQSLTDGDCLVTNYCYWSGISDELRKRFAWPVVAVDRLEHSLDNLTQLIAEHSTRGGR